MPMPPTPIELLTPRAAEQRSRALDRLDRATFSVTSTGTTRNVAMFQAKPMIPMMIEPTIPARSEIQRNTMPTVAAMSE